MKPILDRGGPSELHHSRRVGDEAVVGGVGFEVHGVVEEMGVEAVSEG